MDVTSSFKIMVYSESKAGSEDSLHDRFVSTRPINYCDNATFMRSYCTPEHNVAASLQRYNLVCLQTIHPSDPRRVYHGMNAVPMIRSGHCGQDEVCMNALGPGSARVQGRQWASCVHKSVFDDTMYAGDAGAGQTIELILKDPARNAYVVMSGSDGATPIEADTFDIMSWIDDVIQPEENGTEKKCRDCMNLMSNQFDADTKALKASTKLLTAGALAGIFWFGVMSG